MVFLGRTAGEKKVPKHGLMAVGVTVDKARQMKEAVDLVHGGEDRVCDWTEFFQMNETDYVALVNFTNTSAVAEDVIREFSLFCVWEEVIRLPF